MTYEIAIIDDAFSDELNDELVKMFEDIPFYFGRKPHPDAPFSFWGTSFYQRPDYMGLGITRDLHPSAKILDTIWQQIHPKLPGTFEVLQISSNGQTYGQDGHMHPDDTKPDNYTMLVYVAKEWKVTWGGETNFYPYDNPHENKGTNRVDMWSVLPMPKRVAFFDGRMVHMGSAPNRVFDGLRITVAYKLHKIADK